MSVFYSKCVYFLILIFLASFSNAYSKITWIRYYQLGYRTYDLKNALLCSTRPAMNVLSFELHDSDSDTIVFYSRNISSLGKFGPFKTIYRLDFTDYNIPGSYYIKMDSVASGVF